MDIRALKVQADMQQICRKCKYGRGGGEIAVDVLVGLVQLCVERYSDVRMKHIALRTNIYVQIESTSSVSRTNLH